MENQVLENGNRKVVLTADYVIDNKKGTLFQCYEDDFLQIEFSVEERLYKKMSDEEINKSKYSKFVKSYLKKGIQEETISKILSFTANGGISYTLFSHQNTKIMNSDIILQFPELKQGIQLYRSKAVYELTYNKYIQLKAHEIVALYDAKNWDKSVGFWRIPFSADFYDEYDERYLQLCSQLPLCFMQDMILRLHSYHYLSQSEAVKNGHLFTISEEDKIKMAKLQFLGERIKVKYVERDGLIVI